MESSEDFQNKNNSEEKKLEKEGKSKENKINNQNEIELRKDEGLFSDNNPIPMNLANQVLKSICKIIIKKNNGIIYGTGFFMKLGKSNKNKYLITNYHIISPELTKEDIEIEIYNQKKMKLLFNNRHTKYYPKPKDITIIEIKNTDDIYIDIQLLEFDLNYRLGYKIYRNVNVFSIEHPLGEDAACASGKIKDINNFEFDHNIPTDDGSSGCPIILLNNNINIIQVIGIHKLADYSRKVNCGTFIGEIFKKNEDKKDDKKYVQKDEKNEKIEDNYIIAKFEIDGIDINSDIRIINSYEDSQRTKKEKFFDKGEMNEEEIKNCEIMINDEKIPFSYFFKFKNKGIYSVKYSFKNCLTNVDSMFNDCRNLIKVDLSHFNAQKVYRMDKMFSFCLKLKEIDFPSDIKNVRSFVFMFFGCISLTRIEMPKLIYQKVIDTTCMFIGCKALTYANFSSFNPRNIYGMQNMFKGCESLEKKNIIFGKESEQK